jgi:hypothetical protein
MYFGIGKLETRLYYGYSINVEKYKKIIDYWLIYVHNDES